MEDPRRVWHQHHFLFLVPSRSRHGKAVACQTEQPASGVESLVLVEVAVALATAVAGGLVRRSPEQHTGERQRARGQKQEQEVVLHPQIGEGVSLQDCPPTAAMVGVAAGRDSTLQRAVAARSLGWNQGTRYSSGERSLEPRAAAGQRYSTAVAAKLLVVDPRQGQEARWVEPPGWKLVVSKCAGAGRRPVAVDMVAEVGSPLRAAKAERPAHREAGRWVAEQNPGHQIVMCPSSGLARSPTAAEAADFAVPGPRKAQQGCSSSTLAAGQPGSLVVVTQSVPPMFGEVPESPD